MDIYSTRHIVDVHDVDYNGVARASALLRYLQTSAQSQLTDKGLSYDRLKDLNKAFIISRISIEFTDTVRTYEPITATTFPCHSRGFSFIRCYGLERDGIAVGRAISVWALVDTQSCSLIKVNDFDLGLETYNTIDMQIGRIVMPCTLKEAGKYTVGYGDTDRNRHMNNTKYFDLYASFLPMDKKRFASATVSYVSEAPLGETLTVYTAKADCRYFIRTVRSDGRINTEAEILLTDI